MIPGTALAAISGVRKSQAGLPVPEEDAADDGPP
jgi:hypothetical protein